MSKRRRSAPVWVVYVVVAILAIAVGSSAALIQQKLSAKPAGPAASQQEPEPSQQQPQESPEPQEQPPLVSETGAVEPSGQPKPPLPPPEPQQVEGTGPAVGSSEDVTDPDEAGTPPEGEGEEPTEPGEEEPAAPVIGLLIDEDPYAAQIDEAGYILATDLAGIFGVTVEQREGFGVVLISGGVEAQVADWYPAEDGSLYIRLADSALQTFGYEYLGVDEEGIHRFARVAE